MQENKKRLIDNFLSLTVLQIFSYVIPLITLPYQVRVIGVSNYGLVAFAAAFVQYFWIIIDYGFGICSTKDIATNRHNINSVSHIFNSVIASKCVLAFLCFIIQIIAILLVPKIHHNWLLFALTFLNVGNFILFPAWFFVGMERTRYITVLNVLSRLIFLILLFIVVKKPEDYLLIPLLTSLGGLVSGIIGYYYAVKEFKLKIYIPSLATIVKQIKYSTPFFFSNLSLVAYTNTNTFILGLILSNTLVGYFAAAYNIYNAILGLRYPIAAALYPFMARYKDLKFYIKALVVTGLITFASCLILFICSKLLISVFYGQAMLPAHIIFRILCVAIFVEMVSMFFDYSLLGVFGHMKTVSYVTICGALFHISGLLVLYYTKFISIYNVAALIVATTSLILFLKLFYTYKYRIFDKFKESLMTQ